MVRRVAGELSVLRGRVCRVREADGSVFRRERPIVCGRCRRFGGVLGRRQPDTLLLARHYGLGPDTRRPSDNAVGTPGTRDLRLRSRLRSVNQRVRLCHLLGNRCHGCRGSLHGPGATRLVPRGHLPPDQRHRLLHRPRLGAVPGPILPRAGGVTRGRGASASAVPGERQRSREWVGASKPQKTGALGSNRGFAGVGDGPGEGRSRRSSWPVSGSTPARSEPLCALQSARDHAKLSSVVRPRCFRATT